MASTLLPTVVYIIAFVIAVTIHEFCHALSASLLGDPTPKRAGRLSLNPLSHIDPLGLLCLILIRIGWARPVPFDPHYFKFPRFYSVVVALAGPLSNLLLAFFSIIVLYYLPQSYPNRLLYTIPLFFQSLVSINVMLCLFNLIPLPPLDGSHLLRVTIPRSWMQMYTWIERFSFIILIVLINIPGFQKFFFLQINNTIGLLKQLAVFLLS